MMKRALLFVALTLMSIGANAGEIDGINYYLNFSSHTALVQSKGMGGEKYSGDIVIPATVSYNGEDYTVTAIDQAAFWYCEDVTSITLPNTLTTIGNSAFEGTGITTINIPQSVTTVGEKAFGNCSQLAAITVDEGNSIFDSRENCNALIETATNTLLQACRSTVIPESVTAIGQYAYFGCIWLTSFTVPSQMQNVAKTAFNGCSELASVTILAPVVESYFSRMESIKEVVLGEGVTTIGNEAFAYCSALAAITIPANVTAIGKMAFCGCSALKAINIPASVTSIDEYAFAICTGLQSITVEEGNKNYDSRNNCNALIDSEENTLLTGCVNTVIPNNVAVIGPEAFYQCKDLTSIYLPASVERIDIMAFIGCRLENIVARNPNTALATGGLIPFSNATFNHAMLYVPAGTWGEAVYGNGGWYFFYNIREMAATVKEISASRSYTLMSADNYGYAVYDSNSDQVQMVKAFYSIDEADPNNCWQLVNTESGQCLYNVGAGKYATVTADGEFTLSSTPVPVNMNDGEQGVVMNDVSAKQWNFVQINMGTTDIHSASLPNAKQADGSSVIYDLQGRQLNGKPEKGMYIQDGKKKVVR